MPAAFITNIDALLRGRKSYAVAAARTPWARLIITLTIAGAIYGFAMGSFGDRWLQASYSAAKVPILLLATTAVCLPNFFVLNALLGLRGDFAAALRGILAAQAALAVCLASLAPVTAFFYLSSSHYPFALLLNAGMFAIAAIGGQVALGRHYRPLIEKNPRHRRALAAWFMLYLFVGVKMGSILRPFVGDPRVPTAFFRESAFTENPYTTLFWALVGLGY